MCEWMTLEADLVWIKEDSCRRKVIIQTEEQKRGSKIVLMALKVLIPLFLDVNFLKANIFSLLV